MEVIDDRLRFSYTEISLLGSHRQRRGSLGFRDGEVHRGWRLGVDGYPKWIRTLRLKILDRCQLDRSRR
jgi:hypothetical protein